jgi:hypothetical protein
MNLTLLDFGLEVLEPQAIGKQVSDSSVGLHDFVTFKIQKKKNLDFQDFHRWTSGCWSPFFVTVQK